MSKLVSGKKIKEIRMYDKILSQLNEASQLWSKPWIIMITTPPINKTEQFHLINA